MADIVLAELNGQGWLIRGEQYIDDLLGNTLDPHVSIEVIACQSKSEIDALWDAEDAGDPQHMWMIHPAILARSKGMAAPMVVQFARWSAALEPAALQALQLVLRVADQAPGAAVTLLRTIPADPAPMTAEMADLRSALIEAELTRIGLAAGRIARRTVPDGDPDRIEIRVGAP